MSASMLVRALTQRLHEAGYDSLITPFRVASVEFDFTAALRGRRGRALDLVLIVDTSTGDHGDRDPREVLRRIEALSRALDVTQSRYVLTVILAGATLAGDVDVLAQTCRVLNVETVALDDGGRPVDHAAAQAFDDQIRLLLPLELPSDGRNVDGGVDAIAALIAVIPSDIDAVLLKSVISASVRNDKVVTSAMSKALAESLRIPEEL